MEVLEVSESGVAAIGSFQQLSTEPGVTRSTTGAGDGT
jgi:hypothetical protein